MRLYGRDTGVNGYGRFGQVGLGAMGSGFRVLVHYQLQESRDNGVDKLNKAAGAVIQVMTLNPLTRQMAQVGTTTAGPSGYASLILRDLPAGTPIILTAEATHEWGPYAGETWVGGANLVTQAAGEEELARIELAPATETIFRPGTDPGLLPEEMIVTTTKPFPVMIPVVAGAALIAYLMWIK